MVSHYWLTAWSGPTRPRRTLVRIGSAVAVQTRGLEMPAGTQNAADAIPADLESFGALTDQYIATITGPASVAQQLCLLDGNGQPFL